MGIFDKVFGRQAGVAVRKQIIPTLHYYKQVLIARAQWESLAAVPLLNYRGVDIHLYGVPEINIPYKGCLDPFPGQMMAKLKGKTTEEPNAITDLAKDFDVYVSDLSTFQQPIFSTYRRLFDEAKFEFTDDVEENLELVREQATIDRDLYTKIKFPEDWLETLISSGCLPRIDGLQLVGQQLPALKNDEYDLLLPNPSKIRYGGLTPTEEKHRVLIMANLSPEQKEKLSFFKKDLSKANTDPSMELRSLYKSLNLNSEDVNIMQTKYIASRLQSLVLGPNSLRTYHSIIEKHMSSDRNYLIATIKQRCKIDKFIESLLDSCDELIAKNTDNKAGQQLRILGILDRNLVHLIRQSWDIAVEDYQKINK